MKGRRLEQRDIELIVLHYPREGCAEPWRKVDIQNAIGCTYMAVEYQASRLGFGNLDLSHYKENSRKYRAEHKEMVNRNQSNYHRYRYRTDDEYRKRRLLQSSRYYHEITKLKKHKDNETI